MEINSVIIIITAAASAAIAWLVTRSVFSVRIRSLEDKIKMLDEIYRKEVENAEKLAQQSQRNYEKALGQMKETVLAGMTAETEKLLRKRETELATGNEPSSEIFFDFFLQRFEDIIIQNFHFLS